MKNGIVTTCAGSFGVEIQPYTPWYKTSGIYAIINKNDNKYYVGSCSSFKSRISYHKSKLRNNKHDNNYLQNSWNSNGESAFKFIVLEFCSIDELQVRESHWMNETRCYERNFGYNLDRISIRKMHSEETKLKISNSNKGKKNSIECKLKISISRTGCKHSFPKTKEQREKYSKALMGHFVSEETRKKIGDIHRGKNISKEHRTKVSNGLKKYYESPESKIMLIERARKGNCAKGENIKNSKLKEEDIKKIREMHKNGFTYYRLGKIYDIRSSNIARIIKRLAWKHVP